MLIQLKTGTEVHKIENLELTCFASLVIPTVPGALPSLSYLLDRKWLNRVGHFRSLRPFSMCEAENKNYQIYFIQILLTIPEMHIYNEVFNH